MTTAYFDCFSGISGDMTLGCLVDSDLPSNFSATSFSGLIVLPPADAAIWTSRSVTELELNSLENRIRSWFPPMETRTTCLSVLLPRPGFGGML